jgi:hypothetical protein
MENYIGIMIAVAILYVGYKYYEKRKNKKASGGAGNPSDPRPPTHEV